MRIQTPNDPERWSKDAGVRPAGAEVLLRGARRPQLPGSADLARLESAVDDIPRRSALAARRWMRMSATAVGIATLFALGTGVWAWRGRQLARMETTVALAPATIVAARPAHARRSGDPAAEVALPAPAPARRPAAAARPAKPATVASAPATATTPVGDTLAREIALIDAAREQVTFAPARALVAIDAHRRDFPAGQLAAEREFLAVEALRRLDRLDEARRRAAALAARYPSSSYAARAARALSVP
jgi:hypothetical protein